MKFHSIVASQNWSRWMSVTAAFALLAFIGCGSMDGGGAGGGCTPPPSNQNDNVAGNDNTTGNDNEPAGNDNTVDNDNEPVDNENENDNVSVGNDNNGTGNNDNGTGSNDNEEPGNDNDVNNNDNEDENVNDNTSTNSNANANSNSNVNGNGNVNVNSNTGGGGGGNNEPLETKTSGDERACAAAPAVCDTVTLSLDPSVTTAACFQSVQWTQAATDAIQVTLTPGTLGSATFSVPRVNQVTTSVDLHFNVVSAACTAHGTMGTATVSIQIANASWVGLPTCLEIGDVIDIDEATIAVVTGNPTNSLKLVSVEGLTNEDDYNPFSGVLSPTAGAGTTVMARIQVFGTAGLLDEVEQNVMIMATCP